jgi:putative transposase
MRREDKIALLRVKLLEGLKDIEIRKAMEVPRSTYFYWKSLIEAGRYAELVNKQKPGPKPRFSIEPTYEKRLLLWRKRYGWGPTKMEGHLDAHHNVHIPHNAIHRLFVRNNMNKPIGEPRRTWGKRRWERLHSMSLWQVDWKDINTEFNPMLTFYDDHSRFVAASKRFTEATMENTIKFAEQAFRKYGTPEQMLSDHGSQFTNNNGENLTEFEQFCLDNGVRMCLAGQRLLSVSKKRLKPKPVFRDHVVSLELNTYRRSDHPGQHREADH